VVVLFTVCQGKDEWLIVFLLCWGWCMPLHDMVHIYPVTPVTTDWTLYHCYN
jgi:hypothetical protein